MLVQLWERLFSNALKFARTRAQARIEAGYDAEENAYFVRRHGGRIWADAGPEEGASFYFILP